MRFLTIGEVLYLHEQIIDQTGGAAGLRDQGALESALAQPQMTFGGQDLYPTFVEKAAALGFSPIQNHPFIDGNKRVGYEVMKITLMLNGKTIRADVDDAERVVLGVAASQIGRDGLIDWLNEHVVPLGDT